MTTCTRTDAHAIGDCPRYTATRRSPDLRGIPCAVCGSTTSAADAIGGDRARVICVANADGRARCRARARRAAFR